MAIPRLSSLIAVAACTWMAVGVLAQTDPCEDVKQPAVTTTGGCDLPLFPPAEPQSVPTSWCWAQAEAACDGGPDPFDPEDIRTFRGFPLNLALGFGVAAGDYPPLSLDIYESSSPLLPASAGEAMGPVPFAERPVLQSKVDLITGVPLLREIDFELPFGGATYRHIRTYGEYPGIGLHEMGCDAWEAADLWWDWNGQGWMTGSNPILLINSGYWGSVYPTGERRCYLVLDAHHSIPLTFDALNETWVAPPRFDVIMSHNGDGFSTLLEGPDGIEGWWETPPTEMYLWTNRRSTKYTFKVYWEDVGYHNSDGILTRHAPAVGSLADPGFEHYRGQRWGAPYYALATSIEDMNGNRVLIDYCDSHRSDCEGEPDPATPGCIECCQNCHEKGQVKRVRLTSGEETLWTLLFWHRAFEAPPRDPGFLYPRHQQQAIHSIRVYSGDESLPATCPTIEFDSFETAAEIVLDPEQFKATREQVQTALTNVDDTMWQSPHVADPPESDWVYEVRYLYTDTSDPFKLGEVSDFFGVEGDEAAESPRLLQVTVRHRPDDEDTTNVEEQHTQYRYQHLESQIGKSLFDDTSLRAVIRPGTVDTIHDGVAATPALQDLLSGWPVSLLTLDEADEVPMPPFDRGQPHFTTSGSSTGNLVPTPLIEAADEVYGHWKNTSSLGDYGTFKDSTFHCEIMDYVLLQSQRLLHLSDTCSYFVDRTASGRGRYFKMYRFLYPSTDLLPSSPYPGTCGPAGGAGGLSYFRSLFHTPYLVTDGWTWALPPSPGADPYHEPPLDEPLWVTVVDEYPSLASMTFSDYDDPDVTLAAEDDYFKPISRRLLHINPAGHVLYDRTWDVESGEVTSTEGMHEEYHYDAHGRLLEHRTYGWGTPSNPDEETEGLIRVFGYDASPAFVQYGQSNGDVPKEIGAIGVKKGTDGTVYWLQQVFHNDDRPELPSITVRFTKPRTQLLTPWNDPATAIQQLLPGEAEISEYDYSLVAIPGATASFEKRIESKTTVSTPTKQDDSTDYYAVSKDYFDEEGRVIWRGYGSLADLQNPGAAAHDRFFYDHIQYDSSGRVQAEVVDAEANSSPAVPGSDPEFDLTIGSYPDSTGRLGGAAASPLNYITYTDWGSLGPRTRYFPDGTRREWRYKTIDEELYQLTFNDVALILGNYAALSGGEVTVFDGGFRPQQTYEVTWTDTDPGGDLSISGHVGYSTLSTITPEYDGSGRMETLRRTGSAGSHVAVSGSFDRFGEIARVISPDGTTTRTVNDPLGRPQRVFRGTKDRDEFWGTAPPGAPSDDNMVLLERKWYGEDTTNARLLTTTRHFREDIPLGYPTSPGALFTGEDTYGWENQLEYDWRMRQVWTTRGAQGASSLLHSASYLDNLDRERLTAIFDGGASVASAADPRQYAPGANVPGASAILASTPRRLSETIYNARGLVEERREYDVSVTDGSSYLSSVTYYDYGGRPVMMRSPNTGDRRFEYDALGRQVAAHTYAGGIEVERTETEYNADGKPTVVTRWERRHDSTSGALDSTTGIATYTYNWYDKVGKLLCTAELGTADGNDEFVYASPPDYKPELPPAVHDRHGALQGLDETDPAPGSPIGGLDHLGGEDAIKLTCYGYDRQGRRVLERHHDGTYTVMRYDDLGRVSILFEDAEGDMRMTAFKYQGDKLVKVANVKPSGSACLAQHVSPMEFALCIEVDWDVTDGSLQITEFDYGAIVVDGAGTPISENAGWLHAIRFPHPVSGQPNTTPDFTFTYYADGLLASREDARGVIFDHQYDPLGNRTTTEVYYPSGLSLGSEPANLIDLVEYEYDVATGEVTKVTAWSTENSSPSVVSINEFTYNSRGNLTLEKQEPGDLPTGLTVPQVAYGWDYSPASGDNHDRLETMTYPDRPDSTLQRLLTFDYGATGSVDDDLSRVFTIHDSILSQVVAEYSYSGASRQVAQRIGDVATSTQIIEQSYTGTGGYPLLDRFGRPKDLHFKDLAGDPLHRYEYGYDGMDRQLYARSTIADPLGVSPIINERSHRYGYDGLGRVTQADTGQLDSALALIETGSGKPEAHFAAWNLDPLGNWVGDTSTSTPGALFELYPAGGSTPSSSLSRTDTVDEFSMLTAVSTDSGSGPVTEDLHYDAAGSLILDDEYYYEYDGWNRLVRLSARGGITVDPQTGALSGTPGDWICHFTYDGVGRLIRKQSPWPSQPGELRAERYFFDGARRIQEIWTDPLANGGNDEDSQEEQNNNPSPPPEYTEREYVYTPGYIDEFLFQEDSNGVVLYMLQDTGQDVVALVNDSGEVVEQYTWDPYGQLLAKDSIAPYAPYVNRIGHNGLFFDRTDAPMTAPQLVVGAGGFYQNRNRTYAPWRGRFLQRDPNGAGSPILAAAASMGEFGFDPVTAHEVEAIFTDGYNLYQYTMSDPVNHLDPLGTFSLPSISAGQAMQTGLRTFNTYQTAQTVRGFVNAIQQGISMQQAMLGLVADVIVGRIGGKMADKAFDWVGGFVKRGAGAAGRFCSRRCLAAGTLIQTEHGEVPIEMVTVGTRVLVRSEWDPDAPLEWAEVVAVHFVIRDHVNVLSLADGSTLSLTDDHVVWEERRGWVEAHSLRPGDALADPNREPQLIADIARVEGIMIPAFDLTVSSGASFYANGIWTHNCTLGRLNGAEFEDFAAGFLGGKKNVVLKGKKSGQQRQYDVVTKDTAYEAKSHWGLVEQEGWDEFEKRVKHARAIAKEHGYNYEFISQNAVPREASQILRRLKIAYTELHGE